MTSAIKERGRPWAVKGFEQGASPEDFDFKI